MGPMYTSQATMSRLLGALAAVLLLVAACGGGATPTGSAKSPVRPSTSVAQPTSESASHPPSASAAASPEGPAQMVACDAAGPGWPVTKLDAAADAEAGTTAAAKALVEYVSSGVAANLPDTGWRELYRSRDTALYGQDDPGGQPDVLLVATIRATNGTWAGEGNGQCRLQAWLGSTLRVAGTWKLSARTSKTSTSLKVLVTEKACSGGQSAKGRIAKPKLDIQGDRVVITIGVTPLPGPQSCRTVAGTPLTVPLPEALGTRQLFDGGAYPAVAVAQPK